MEAETKQHYDKQGKTKLISGFGSFFAAILCVVLITLLVPQLLSRRSTQLAKENLGKDKLEEAKNYLDRAKGWMNPVTLDSDKKRINLIQGELHLRRAEKARTVTILLEEIEKAEKLFRTAVTIDPLDIDGYTGLALVIAGLEKIYPFVHRHPFPYSAVPTFERLLELMPVNIYAHTLLTKYYFSKKMLNEMTTSIGRSLSLYPPLYHQLKKQSFYAMAMKEMVKKSLNSAIDNGVYVESAYRCLADLAVQEKNYKLAIEYFLKTRPSRPYRDNSRYDLQLGTMYLEAKQFQEAEDSFFESLKTKDQERRLNEIWNRYRRCKCLSEFLFFFQKVDDNNLSEHLTILRAKCLIEQQKYELANSYLIRIESEKYAAEIFYLQAKIAEYKKDWDTMELRSQRATVLEPANSSYHQLFSRALNYQKKWLQAEQAANQAIARSIDVNPWLYNHRAWIRWSRKNYDGAEKDWQKAIETDPENSWFYFNVAMISEREGKIEAALRQVKRALILKPDEQRFQEKRGKLEKIQQQ